MAWEARSGLKLPNHLSSSHFQLWRRSEPQRVAVIADLAMRSPSPARDAPLMMSREVPGLAHKAKGRLRGQPSKPLRAVRGKGKQPLLGAHDHIVPVLARLD